MHNQIGKIGAIRRILDGKACPFCRGHKYQLVLRGNMQPASWRTLRPLFSVPASSRTR